MLVHGKFRFAFSCHPGAGIFNMSEMLRRCFAAIDIAAAQAPELIM